MRTAAKKRTGAAGTRGKKATKVNLGGAGSGADAGSRLARTRARARRDGALLPPPPSSADLGSP